MNSTTFRSRAGDKYSGLELAKRAIKMFVAHKSQMNPSHQFAFLVFKEEATMIQSFTSRAQDILKTLDESEIEPQESDSLNFSHFFETIKENVDLPEVQGDPRVMPPPYIVRVLLLFGRSQSVPISPCQKAQRELESSPYFFTDVLYIHEPPSEENKCEEIFKVFCDLDHNGMSYIFEQSKYTPILNSGAKLLAHPLQRPRQLDAVYKISTTFIPTAQSQPVAPAEERVY
ncbi:BRISC and BRCA1-A complex member 1-like [Elysia marginata]|uniref:BRISC and BRCA1-A complex member 1-like n=1 Tax=Elysia marginata TaxID=1093978 RepID=A0AAV4H9W4_9GAST|nr:BRISC and BRCA1-A complex member 1-like [Elysia marginata]